MKTHLSLVIILAATPAFAECPEYMSADHCRYFYGPRPPPPEVDLKSFEPTPRRSYQPTYQEPIPEKPDTRFDAYRLEDAIRQIPNYNLRNR